MPWPELRGIALGALGWSPEQFHNSTFRDIHEGWEVYRKVNGLTAKPSEGGMTRERLEELKRQYPDGGPGKTDGPAGGANQAV